MSYEGAGSPISQQDAVDLLHKLITESAKVVALYRAAEGRVSASVEGLIRLAPDGTLWVVESSRERGPMIGFDPALFVIRKYGDTRAMRDGGNTPFGTKFRSVLVFAFVDGSTLGIHEIDDLSEAPE
jgi:hypothetical protein